MGELLATWSWGIGWGVVTGAAYGVLVVVVAAFWGPALIALLPLGVVYGGAIGAAAGAVVGLLCGIAVAATKAAGALGRSRDEDRRRLRLLLPSVAAPATALGSGGLVRGYDPLVFLMFVAGPTVVAFLLAVRRAKQLSNRERSNP